MLSPVDLGEMSDVIDYGLETIAIIPPSKDSASNIEAFRYSFILFVGMGGAYAIESTNCLDKHIETGSMLSPVEGAQWLSGRVLD